MLLGLSNLDRAKPENDALPSGPRLELLKLNDSDQLLLRRVAGEMTKIVRNSVVAAFFEPVRSNEPILLADRIGHQREV